MYGAFGVDLGLQATGQEGGLGALEDVEVVVGGMAAGVALGADGGAEEDEILGDGGMQDVHGAHGPARIVEHPLPPIRRLAHRRLRERIPRQMSRHLRVPL